MLARLRGHDSSSTSRQVSAPSNLRMRAAVRMAGSAFRMFRPMRVFDLSVPSQCVTQPQVLQRWNSRSLSPHE
jgi:hypothetical protein